MEIIHHPSATRTLPAPDDWDKNAECDPLPVTDMQEDGRNWMVSFWKPSKEDLDVLLAGGFIALQVNANTPEDHPVIGLGVSY